MNRPLRLRNVCCNCYVQPMRILVHVKFTHVHQRLPTCTHCRDRFIVPAYYGIHGVDNRVQPMFILVRPL
ncbi:hypothetical protein [Prevotella pallens]|uniref:hypothetical protein n=1 Tax=Prevotella pallens TaxID=60133 RepID=UPI0023F458D0|nr:hypothetical protein [Prevotella pallens]